MSHFPPGEGPIDDIEAAKARAKAEHAKPEHKPKDKDPRDKGIDADLDKHQEADK